MIILAPLKINCPCMNPLTRSSVGPHGFWRSVVPVSPTQVTVCGVEHYSRAGTIYSALAFAGPDNEYLLTATMLSAPYIQVYHIGSHSDPREIGVPVYELLGHTSNVVYISLATEGKLLVTAGTDNTVLLWDAKTVYERCRHVLDTCEDPDRLAEEKAKPLTEPRRLGTGMLVTTDMAVSR